MRTWKDIKRLELVESFARKSRKDSWLIRSEKHLSEKFDEEWADFIQFNIDDPVMLRACFDNYTLMLNWLGILHPEQYNSYSYVGKYVKNFG